MPLLLRSLPPAWLLWLLPALLPLRLLWLLPILLGRLSLPQ